MSDVLQTLSLDLATLSGGARIAAAAGGLPRRITTALDVDMENVLGTSVNGSAYGGAVFAADGLHVWCSNYNGSTVKKIRISDAAVINTINVTNPMNLSRSRPDGNLFIAATGKIIEVNSATGDIVNNVSATGNWMQAVQVPGVTNKIWVRVYSDNLPSEYSWPGMVATGRSITTGSSCTQMAATTGKLFVSTRLGVKEYRESDLAVLRTYGTQNVAPGRPGRWGISGAYWYHIALNPVDGKLHVCDTLGQGYVDYGCIERYNVSDGTFDRRVMWPGVDVGGAQPAVEKEGPAFAFSDDATKLVQVIGNWTGTGITSIRVKTIGVQRARWTRTFSSAVTLHRVHFPGCLGNTRGAYGDFRRTKTYYSLDGGSTRVEFTPSTPLIVAITAGQTLTVDADMAVGFEKPPGDCYIGGDAGEGIELVYDDPAATVYTPQPTLSFKGRMGTTAFKGKMT